MSRLFVSIISKNTLVNHIATYIVTNVSRTVEHSRNFYTDTENGNNSVGDKDILNNLINRHGNFRPVFCGPRMRYSRDIL